MLNCAWRPRINNYILNFRLDHFGRYSILFIEQPNSSLASVWQIRLAEVKFFRSFAINVFSPFLFICNLASSRLSLIACGTLSEFLPVVYPRRAKRLSSQKIRSCLSAFHSVRCRCIRRRSYSWLTTSEYRLAKLIFVLLFGFLKDKRKQDGVRDCMKIIHNAFSQNDWTRALIIK